MLNPFKIKKKTIYILKIAIKQEKSAICSHRDLVFDRDCVDYEIT